MHVVGEGMLAVAKIVKLEHENKKKIKKRKCCKSTLEGK